MKSNFTSLSFSNVFRIFLCLRIFRISHTYVYHMSYIYLIYVYHTYIYFSFILHIRLYIKFFTTSKGRRTVQKSEYDIFKTFEKDKDLITWNLPDLKLYRNHYCSGTLSFTYTGLGLSIPYPHGVIAVIVTGYNSNFEPI